VLFTDKFRPHYVMKSTGGIQSDLSEHKNILCPIIPAYQVHSETASSRSYSKRALNLTEEVLDGMAGWERLFSEIPGEAAEGIRRRIRKRLGVFMGCLWQLQGERKSRSS